MRILCYKEIRLERVKVGLNNRVLVFDTDSSFFMIDMFNNNFISSRHIVKDRPGYDEFTSVDMRNMYGIFLYQNWSETQLWPTRNMIYRLEDDQLFQDMNEVLDRESGNDTRYLENKWFRM